MVKIAVFYGTKRHGSTYHITKQILEKLPVLQEDITEFFLPDAMPNFCRGCFRCIANDLSACPDYADTKPMIDAIVKADILVFASPTYVYHVTGQMKTMLDHFAFWWMVHRPEKSMFSKQAIVISTAAGAGTKSAMGDVIDTLNFWGVGRRYTYGVNVYAADWQGVSEKIKQKISKDTSRLVRRVMRRRQKGKVTPSLKIKMKFYAMRFFQKRIGISQTDVSYWKSMGWLSSHRPWKSIS